MGKKSKKVDKTEDQQLTNLERSELRDGIQLDKHKKQKCDPNVETNDSTVSITKLKKKNRKRNAEGLIQDTSEQIKSEVNETNAPTNFISTETKKKKKKKSKLLEEIKQETEPEIAEVQDHKQSKDSKKKKYEGNLLNELNSVEETPQTQNEQVKQKKKSKSKAKTGAPVLNDEESQVTEEDIDRFCDELDEEDNKQYEEWVQLLDARLSKKQPQKNYLECNVQWEENQRSPIPHEIPPSPAMYVECGGSANSTSSTSCYQFNVQSSIDEDNMNEVNMNEDKWTPKIEFLKQLAILKRLGCSSKRVRRSLCEERPQLAVTSSVAASSSSDRNPAASLRPQRPLRDLEIEGLLHYGSEEESESEDDELEAAVLVPRALRVLWETPVDEEEEVVERAAPSSAPVDEDEQVAERAAPSSAPEDEDVEVAERAAPSSASESYLPQFFFDFEWRSFPNPPIPPETRREPFRHTDCGPTIRVTDPYDIFTTIWDREFMEFVATETNRYAEEVAEKMINTGELCLNSRIVNWKDTTVDELYIYMAIILAMGVVIKSRTEEYWNTEMDIFCTPGFRVNMSLRRFQLLNKCLHFNSTANMVGLNLSSAEAKLFKVQPVISHLNAKFSALYIMEQNIALDESLLQWKGRLDINQFIPNKAAAVGIKSYEICESATGYLWRFQIHASKPRTPQASQDADPLTASTPALVLDLIKGLEHAGYTLWMDNFYNSPALARKLKSIGFDCVGTLRTNRKLVPVELNNLTKTSMRPGQIVGFTSGDVDVMVWRDKNRVATISTYHSNTVSTVDNNSTKPIVIRDYNVCMGGVDKKDQMLATYPIERKRTRIWYKKLFRRLLNVSTLNAYIIHKKNATVKLPHRNFRRTLINTILKKHAKPAFMPTPAGQGIYEAKYHYPAEYPFLVTPRSSNRQRHACRVCHKRTTTFCAGCNKAVCAFKCFSALHA